MNNENEFNDPLADFDPVMESAFSINEEETTPPPIEEPSQEPTQATSQPIPQQPIEDVPADLNKDDSFFDNDESFDIDESLFEEKETGVSVSKVQFEAPQSSIGESQTYDKNLFKNIKVDVSIELGRSKVSLKKLYELKSGSIIELGRLVGEPLDLVINDQVIARGEVVAVNSNYGIRITHVESLANLA